ncbi:ATP-binding protein [Neobacillus drentensis]|uniref:ATP-binding protein n=1 Tax=Neobacillus drentensis TaxID=220684 RepID=UPI003002D253
MMNNIHCKLSAEETPIIITCEKNQIKQVFLNVIKNSIEAMDKGGDIQISLRKSQNGFCKISFQDQGCGIKSTRGLSSKSENG